MSDHTGNNREGLRLNERLKRAVNSEAVPPYLEARIRNSIRAGERSISWGRRLVPVAAAVVVCIGAAVAYELGYLPFTLTSQEAYITSVSNRVGTLMRAGLGDHIHCSVFRKFPANPPKLEDLAAKLGDEYQGLVPIVRQQVPGDYRLMIAHQCRHRGRKFVHLSLKSDSQLLSLVIARKNEGESFQTEGLIPALAQSGIAFYRAGVERFEIASFESPDYLVYFVSDLPQERNLQMMAALAPGVRDYLRNLEL